MLSVGSLSLAFGPKVIFDDVSFNINKGDRIALVGLNGSGKTTLLRILNGSGEQEEGSINIAKNSTIGYLPQVAIVDLNKTLFDETRSTFQHIIELEHQLENPDLTPDQIAHISDQLEHHNYHTIASRIESILLGLGFKMSDMNRLCSEFSGGWQMRIALAKLLLIEPDLLMLDEPTNHLDIRSQIWLESYLKSINTALLVISHDAAFLDSLTNKTFHLNRGRVDLYAGNYSYFLNESQAREELLKSQYANQQRKIEKTQQFIDRFRAKATKAKQVQSRIKALEKVDRIELDSGQKKISFKFPPAPRSGQVTFTLKDVSKSYGDKQIYSHLNLKIERGQRVAIVGNNGAGKSTLLKLLAQIEQPSSGTFELGHNVERAYFAQDFAEKLDPNKTLLQTIEAAASGEAKRNARATLGAFLFHGDDVFKPVKVLSGGEKCRLAMACLLLQDNNFLILDEPTNHLDIQSKEIFQDAIGAYTGTLVIVSHDRQFTDPLVDIVLEVTDKSIKTFHGNISDYIASQNLDPTAVKKKEKVKAAGPVAKSKESRQERARERERLKPLKAELKKVESQIEELEQEKLVLEEQMGDPEFYQDSEKSKTTIARYQLVERELEQLMPIWESLTEEIG